MRYKKMLVLEDGQFITLQDREGNRAWFSSVSDFEKYTGTSLGSYWNINYEPDSNIFTLDKEHKVLSQMNSTLYESLISGIPTWKSRQADKFYGMDSEVRKVAKLEDDLAAIDAQVQQADKQLFSYDGHTYYPDTEFIHGMFSMLPYLPDNYTESWKTAEKQVDGISNVYVTLDKVGLAGLASTYFQFKKSNWAAGELAKQQLKDEFLGD